MADEEWSGDELVEMFYELRAKRRRDEGAEWPTPRTDWSAFWKDDPNDAQWLVEPILPAGRSVAVWAGAGDGKSAFVLWMAAALATGREVFGRSGAPVHVVYLDYEMTASDLRERLEEMGYDDTVDLEHLHYFQLPSLPPLDTEMGGRAVMDIVERIEPALVVVDTFSRALDGGENDSDTVRAWYRHTGQKLKAAGVAYIRLDHAGKDRAKGQRGTSAKADDVDVVWELVRADGEERILKARKRRMGWVPERVRFERHEDPDEGTIGFRLIDGARGYVVGTAECAADLEELGAPVNISTRKAQELLRNHLRNHRRQVVVDAVRYRKTEPQVEPHGNQAEPLTEALWEPPGTPIRGTGVPSLLEDIY